MGAFLTSISRYPVNLYGLIIISSKAKANSVIWNLEFPYLIISFVTATFNALYPKNEKYSVSFVFAFILATVPSFHGYYMKGGALEVGKASTKSFIWTSVSIVVFNFLITQMLLG